MPARRRTDQHGDADRQRAEHELGSAQRLTCTIGGTEEGRTGVVVTRRGNIHSLIVGYPPVRPSTPPGSGVAFHVR
ncbi:hypothetical protein GCM10009610_26180 [Pseudonocardia xinjiangensis]